MSQGSIDREGVFVDITVPVIPVELAQAFKKRIAKSKGYSIDELNCSDDNSGSHIRIICTLPHSSMHKAACFELIREIGRELGISFSDDTQRAG